MSKFSEFLARKAPTSLGSNDANPPGQRATEAVQHALDVEGDAAEVGSRLGAENEALRALVLDTARKIDELDTLKHAFGRIIDPLHKTMLALEQEKSQNASLMSTLSESRASAEALRTGLLRSDKLAASLTAANEKLQNELEQAGQTIAALEDARIELTNQNSAKATQISDLESRLGAESATRQSLADEHHLVSEQFQAAGKRLSALETEVVAARQKIALLEDERQSLQSSLDQTVGEVSRLSRQLADATHVLSAAQGRLTQIQTSLAESETERTRLTAALDEARERHRAESNAQTMRLDALQSRAATAEKLLAEARTNLAARADEIRAFDRKIVEATIARNSAEKKLAQLESAHEAHERQLKDVEQARAALAERNAVLARNLRTRETALARAEEKIVLSSEMMARSEAEGEESRNRAEKRIEEVTALLERERMERAVAEGALEAARKDIARLQRENAALEAAGHQRVNGDAPLGPSAKRGKAKGNVEPIMKG
jgi:crescentin